MPTKTHAPRAVWPRVQFMLALLLLFAFPATASAQTHTDSATAAQDYCMTKDSAKHGSLSGTVTSAKTGAPIDNARVEVEDIYGRMIHSAYTDEEGNWTVTSLSPMDYFVTFSGPAGESAESYITEVYDDLDGAGNATILTVQPAQNITGIDAELAVGAVVQGKVTDSTNDTPIDGAGVTIYDADTLDYLAYTSTDDDGTYRFHDGFRPGEYFMFLYADGFADEIYEDAEYFEDATVITVTGIQTTTVNATLDPIDETGTGVIKGRVTLADTGDPAGNAYVSAIGVGDTNRNVWYISVDTQGYYTLTLPAGTWRIQVDPSWAHPDYAARNIGGNGSTPNAEVITVTAGATIEGKNVALGRGWYIEGIVTGLGGAPVDGAWIYADEGETYIPNGLDDLTHAGEDGEFRIGPLLNVPFTLSVNTSIYDCTLIDEEIVINPPASPTGTVNMNFALEQGGLITGRVTTGSPAIGVDSFSVSQASAGSTDYSYTSGTGHYLSDALPAGSYIVAFNSWGYKLQFFDNKPDKESAAKVVVAAGGIVAQVNALVVKGSVVAAVVT